jgi:hypothetical protein
MEDQKERYYISNDFIKFWLKKDSIPADSSKETVQATVLWLEDLEKSFYNRMDVLWEKLSKSCVNCMKQNCESDYNWLKDNSIEISKNETREFSEIKFPTVEIGREGVKKLENYKKCKRTCYEKIVVINSLFGKTLTKLQEHMTECLDGCKIKKLTFDSEKSDCISRCLIHIGYQLPTIEYYFESVYTSLQKEYDQNIIDLPKTDLPHQYRNSFRQFGKEQAVKYL